MKKLFALASCAMLIFSCSENISEIPLLKKLPINISVGVQTRANDTAFDKGDAVGLYVVNYDGTTAGTLKDSGNQADNTEFIFNGDGWNSKNTIYWKDENTSADFYAYYPYSASVNVAAHPFAVKADQRSEANFWASDFLWGKTTNIAPTSDAVNIQTNHVLSRIILEVNPGRGFTSESWASATKSVKICDVKTNATIDIATGIATATGSNGDILPMATSSNYMAMIIPQTVAEDSKLIVVTVDGIDYAYRTGYTFKANTQHNFSIEVNRDNSSVNVSIGEWNIDDTLIHGVAVVDPDSNDMSQLEAPALRVESTTETSITIAWDAVENADKYIVIAGDKANSTAECAYTLENLNAGEYTFRVKAQGEGYKDSDFASISAYVTAPTSVSWFTQTLIPVSGPTEVDGQVLQPWNAVYFNWTGTDVVELHYGFFETVAVDGLSTDEIKNALSDGSVVLADVNTVEGFTTYFNGLTGNTSYTLYAWVKNAVGVEFLASSEITTAEAELADATKAWLGSYTAQTSKMVNLNSGEITDKVTEFTFTVESIEGTSDEVWVYGLSGLGSEFPAHGYVIADDWEGIKTLCIMSYEAVADIGQGWYAMWFPYCQIDTGYTFVTGSFVGYAFAMDYFGDISYVAGYGQLNEDMEFTVAAMDILGYDGDSGLGLLIAEDGTEFVDWKFGDMTNIVKVEATPSVASKSAANLSVGRTLPASVVVVK